MFTSNFKSLKRLIHIRLVVVVAIILALLPFFWLKPGEMDLGGDSSRLYFYDPLNYLKNLGLYSILPVGTGNVVASYYNIPFVILLFIIKSIIQSSYVLILLFNILKILIGFLSVYGIIKVLIEKKETNNKYNFYKEISAILAGLFYIFSPGLISNYDKALITHNQVFLNPLMFYLLLQFFLKANVRYLWIIIIVSFIFSPNFSYIAAPPFFAFYPISMLFIGIYTIFIRKITVQWKKIIIAFLIFVGLHAFHIIPELHNLFQSGSNINTRVFDKSDIQEQINYFLGVLPIPKVSLHLLADSPVKEFNIFSFIVPLSVIFGLIFNAKKGKTILLTGIFFLLCLFMVTAKISDTGIELYKSFFVIPGFAMFRNFYGQWQFVFYFFYALFFGQALYMIFPNFKKKSSAIFIAGMAIYLTASAWNFINGTLINQVNHQSKNVRVAIEMDPQYEEVLTFIRLLPHDGKILTLPFTDCCFQVLYGKHEGAYVGVSTIGHLTGKNDFSGYANIAPFSDLFWYLAKEKDYESIKQMLGLLNIKYIFYNSDPRIYDYSFPSYPYSPDYVRKYMPATQKEYKEFVDKLSSIKLLEKESYNFLLIKEDYFLPHFYIPKKPFFYKPTKNYSIYGGALSFLPNKDSKEVRSVYLDEKECIKEDKENLCKSIALLYNKNVPKITFAKINPTKYKVRINGGKEPFLLVFSETFNKNWKVFLSPNIDTKNNTIKSYFGGDIKEERQKEVFLGSNIFETIGMKQLSDRSHIMVNGYANGWYIWPKDVLKKENYELIIELMDQRIFYFSLLTSIFIFFGCSIVLICFCFNKMKIVIINANDHDKNK